MEPTKTLRKKRTQCDYTLGFKLQVVDAVEKGDMTCGQAQKIYGIQGHSTVLQWLRKHGKLNWTQPVRLTMPKPPKSKETPAQKIKRLDVMIDIGLPVRTTENPFIHPFFQTIPIGGRHHK